MNSMPYTQKEGRCLWCGKMEDGDGAEEERQEEDEAKEGNKNGTWVYLSLSCNEQHSLSLFLCLSNQMCYSFVFSMKTKCESFPSFLALLSPSLSSHHHLHFFFLLPLNTFTLLYSFTPLPSPYLHSPPPYISHQLHHQK